MPYGADGAQERLKYICHRYQCDSCEDWVHAMLPSAKETLSEEDDYTCVKCEMVNEEKSIDRVSLFKNKIALLVEEESDFNDAVIDATAVADDLKAKYSKKIS